jgi:hypothetical protein
MIEKNEYMVPIDHDIVSYDYFEKKYKSINFGENTPYFEQHYQYYRMYDVHNLMCEHQSKTGVEYDYIIRTRMDVDFNKNLMELMDMLEDPMSTTKVIMVHNLLVICKGEMSDIFKLIYKYGTYMRSVNDNRSMYKFFLTTDDKEWTLADNWFLYSSEKQCVDSIYEYCEQHHLSIQDTFVGVRYGTYLTIYR